MIEDLWFELMFCGFPEEAEYYGDLDVEFVDGDRTQGLAEIIEPEVGETSTHEFESLQTRVDEVAESPDPVDSRTSYVGSDHFDTPVRHDPDPPVETTRYESPSFGGGGGDYGGGGGGGGYDSGDSGGGGGDD
jgi:hypothetical protein